MNTLKSCTISRLLKARDLIETWAEDEEVVTTTAAYDALMLQNTGETIHHATIQCKIDEITNHCFRAVMLAAGYAGEGEGDFLDWCEDATLRIEDVVEAFTAAIRNVENDNITEPVPSI